MFSRLELRFSKILGKIFFLHADLLGFKFLIFFFITLFLGAFFWPRYQARTSRFFTIFLTVFLALSSFMTAAECMDDGEGTTNKKNATEQGAPSSRLPAETPDFAKQLLDAQRKRAAVQEQNELHSYLKGVESEHLELETKRLEYEILLGNSEFRFQCISALRGEQFPMLEEQFANTFETRVEEVKLRNLLRNLLAHSKKDYTLENLWLLERALHKPGGVKSIVEPFLAEFSRKGR